MSMVAPWPTDSEQCIPDIRAFFLWKLSFHRIFFIGAKAHGMVAHAIHFARILAR